MGDGADDARATEEMWQELRDAHNAGVCGGYDPVYGSCPYCNPEFEPMFEHEEL